MPDLPKSVIARMKAQAAPQEHPDADLLAAFSEQALTGREREGVLAHLASCAPCREAVALASPQPVAVQPAGVFVPWYRRPQVFAWAGTLATLALVGALVLNYGQSPRPNITVTDATPPRAAETRPTENKPAAPVAQDQLNAAVGAKGRAEAPRRDADLAKVGREQGKLKTEEEHAMRAMASAPKSMQAPNKDEKKTDGGPLQSQYSVMKEAAAPPPAPAAQAANVVNEKQQAAAEADAVTVQSAAVARPKSADLAVSGGTAGALHQSRAAKMAVAAPRWSISEKGRLQRSFDSGRTWQPALTGESTVFRALSVVDNEVWAGGTSAALFHSADGGANWTRQTLPGASAAVVTLQFNDAQHGTAKTADGATWSTADGGLHWAKQ